jgi:ketosteroid isomerase-like protein
LPSPRSAPSPTDYCQYFPGARCPERLKDILDDIRSYACNALEVTDVQICELISNYQAAFNRLDATGIAAFYDEPSAIVDGTVTAVFAERRETQRNMEALTSYYRSLGFTAAESTRIDVEHVSEAIAEVDVGWTLHMQSGTVQFATRYWVVDRAGEPRIASVLAHSEERAIADRP